MCITTNSHGEHANLIIQSIDIGDDCRGILAREKLISLLDLLEFVTNICGDRVLATRSLSYAVTPAGNRGSIRIGEDLLVEGQ